MKRTVVLDVVGLTRDHLGPHTPRIAELAKGSVDIEPVTPAVTCTAQTTYLTGTLPREHGIVANGWYFRDLAEVWLWRQSNHLVQSPPIWDVARERDASFTCANLFWWYAMATRADVTFTPRPLYLADGAKLPDCYAHPHELREEFSARFGTFPLFSFWGPATTIASSEWIANAAMAVEEKTRPTLNLVYLPHLDYVLQREGPDGPSVRADLAAIDALVGRLIDFFRDRDVRVVLLSEYAIVPVSRPVHPNRILRDAELLSLKVDLGREYLDPGPSRAFAVSDHQIAHVYTRDAASRDAAREALSGTPGIAAILDEDGKRAHGLDHERSGDLVLLAESDAWFTYYFWQDDACAPDYARMVDIHKKPGYDPCELYIDPALAFPKLEAAYTLARKWLGFRYKMELTPLDATLVRGSHGVAAPIKPLFMTSEPRFLAGDALAATDVRDLLLDHVFRD